MLRRFPVLLLVAGTAVLLGGCGSDDSSSTSAAGPTVDDQLSQVAAEFGAAYIRGDMDTVVELLPAVEQEAIPDEIRQSFSGATELSRTVELRNFGTVVEVNEDGTATATYRGERCSTSGEAPSTTLGTPESRPGEPVAPPPSATEVCIDIAEQAKDLTPFTFQRVDGRWYPNLPDLR